jgi:hypothetical protein
MKELSGMTSMNICHRWCKRPIFCGNEYMQEVAYCYVEGSFCQRWIYRQIQQQTDEENEGEINIKCTKTKNAVVKHTSLFMKLWCFYLHVQKVLYYRQMNISQCIYLPLPPSL